MTCGCFRECPHQACASHPGSWAAAWYWPTSDIRAVTRRDEQLSPVGIGTAKRQCPTHRPTRRAIAQHGHPASSGSADPAALAGGRRRPEPLVIRMIELSLQPFLEPRCPGFPREGTDRGAPPPAVLVDPIRWYAPAGCSLRPTRPARCRQLLRSRQPGARSSISLRGSGIPPRNRSAQLRTRRVKCEVPRIRQPPRVTTLVVSGSGQVSIYRAVGIPAPKTGSGPRSRRMPHRPCPALLRSSVAASGTPSIELAPTGGTIRMMT